MARRRPTAEFDATQSEAGPRTITIDSPIGGYNGYVSPDLLNPKFWAQSSNVYAGQFGTIRRARWAPVLNSLNVGYTNTGIRIASLFSYFPPTAVNPVLLVDNDTPAIGSGIGIILWKYGLTGGSSVNSPTLQIGEMTQATTIGPWMRFVPLPALILQCNGKIRSKIAVINPNDVSTGYFLSYWGLDTPDSSTQVTLIAGSTATIVAATGASRTSNITTITATAPLPAGFITGIYVGISGVADTSFNTAAGTAVQITVTGAATFTYPNTGPNAISGSGTATLGITKTVGRSYQWAWENVNTGHVSAPAPASEFVKYTSQRGTIDCIQTGTVSTTGGSANVVGTNTQFSSAWVGRKLWVPISGGGASTGFIASVTDATHLTMDNQFIGTNSGLNFQVYDLQSTHVRLYATGDGGSVYFLIARNFFNHLGNSLSASGLEFSDTANSEPPNAPFSSEITQVFNVPPPIGAFLQDYQGRALVYGVTAALQTFFYSNIENTVVGQPPESFGTLNTVTLPIGDGQINGMANLPTGLLIWSNHQDMFKLTGLLADNSVANATQLGATIQRLPYKIGCGSPYATAVTPLGAIWLSSDREVWLFTDHYAPKNIGKPVQDVLNRINGARLPFAKMTYYKRGDRSWLALAIALDSSTFNNKLLLLDLDLLASNGQPSFFTFDLATNAPTWYPYDVNCESIATAYDTNSVNHLLTGDVDLITDLDWQPGFYTVTAEQSVPGSNKLHAFGNEDPHMIKTFQWMRALTNQIPKNLSSQGWAWSVDAFDDDVYVVGVNPLTTNLIPGVDSNSNPLFMEYSPALFKFGGVRPVKGRRFQIGTIFPSAPGLFELRGFQISYNSIVGR